MQILKEISFLLVFSLLRACADDFLEEEIRLEDKKDTDNVLGTFVTEFFADSQWQLIVDLDFFKTFFLRPTSKFEKALKSSDESYIKRLLALLEPLKVLCFLTFFSVLFLRFYLFIVD